MRCGVEKRESLGERVGLKSQASEFGEQASDNGESVG